MSRVNALVTGESHGIGSHDCRAFCGYRGFSLANGIRMLITRIHADGNRRHALMSPHVSLPMLAEPKLRNVVPWAVFSLCLSGYLI
jgi:hypothetical protein